MPNLGYSMRYGEFHFLRYFRTKNKIKEITLEQDFDHLEWSDVKKNISNRFRTDFCTGYRSADFFWGSTELETATIWRQLLIRPFWVSRFKQCFPLHVWMFCGWMPKRRWFFRWALAAMSEISSHSRMGPQAMNIAVRKIQVIELRRHAYCSRDRLNDWVVLLNS